MPTNSTILSLAELENVIGGIQARSAVNGSFLGGGLGVGGLGLNNPVAALCSSLPAQLANLNNNNNDEMMPIVMACALKNKQQHTSTTVFPGGFAWNTTG
jgi:hypothetical protein